MSPTFAAWACLVLTLSLTTFGIQGILQIAICFFVVIISSITTLFVIGHKWAEDYWNIACISRLELPSNGIPRIKETMLKQSSTCKLDKRYTGSTVIDEQLKEIVELTIRDYIMLWYRKISDDNRFPDSLQHSIQQAIISFAERAKEVDWMQFFTIQLFDDVASHFRLFRKAQHLVAQSKKADPKDERDLVSAFFELEQEMVPVMERHGYWKEICTNVDEEKVFLRDFIEVLLYLLLPPDDFNNRTFRYLTRELFVNSIVLPTLNLFTDPDYVNQTIIWLCKEVPVTSEGFLIILRLTNNVDELIAVQDRVNHEIAVQRSKDSGGDDDAVIKQQLSSLLFVKRVVDHRLNRLQEGVDTDSAGLPAHFDWKKVMSAGYKLYSLPLEIILKNNVALSYFIDFMMCTGNHTYMFFYLTIEGYRASAEQHISQLQFEHQSEVHSVSSTASKLEPLREAASNIYEQYLSAKAMPKIKLDESLIKRLYHKIQTESPSATWFDEVRAKILELLSEEKFFGAFKKSPQYIKMLAELDLLKDTSKIDDDDSLSLDGLHQTGSDSVSMSSQDDSLHSDSAYTSLSNVVASRNTEINSVCIDGLSAKAKIVGTGLIEDSAKRYVVYAVEVIKTVDGGKDEKWQVYRRYSDFHDFHMSILEQFTNFIGHNFPAKKTFNNMNPEFLGKRMQQLNDYLIFLLKPETCKRYPGIQQRALRFLEPVSYYKAKGQFVKRVNRVINPIRDSVRTMGHLVRAAPDNLIVTVDCMMDGLARVLHGKNINQLGLQEGYRMTAGLDLENDEDIPLRILLLLVDEVFDLKSRNQWLRRRMVILLREFIRTMYGDRINRTILDYVEWLTSADQIAEYIKTFRNTLWPNGFSAGPVIPRDYNTKMRTRISAKAKMLCFLPDEMKHIIGSETTRRGIHLVFEMFQHSALNRRLLYELLEHILKLIFPDNNISDILNKLHSKNDSNV